MKLKDTFCTSVSTFKRRELLLHLIKISVYCICLTFFIVLMRDVWEKYTTEITSNGIRIKYSEKNKKHLPCFTARPYLAYKNPGFIFTDEEYERNTLNLEDIFSEESVRVSISPTVWRKAQMCKHISHSTKDAVTFHQYLCWDMITCFW